MYSNKTSFIKTYRSGFDLGQSLLTFIGDHKHPAKANLFVLTNQSKTQINLGASMKRNNNDSNEVQDMVPQNMAP